MGSTNASVFAEVDKRLFATMADRATTAIALHMLHEETQARHRALALSETRLQLATEAAGLGAWDHDLQSGEILWDARCHALYEWPPGMRVDQSVLAGRLHPDDRAWVLDSLRQVCTSAPAAGNPWSAEHRIVVPSRREPLWVRARALILRDAAGKPVRLVGTCEDITREKEAQLRARAQAVFDERLVGIVSHDLRNPIAAIGLTAATLLRRKTLAERERGMVDRIAQAASRAQRMVRDLLDFTQARLGGQVPVFREPTALRRTVRQVVEETRLAHPGRQIVLEHCGEGEGAFDTDRMAQVLSNLLSNALQHGSPERPVRVGLRDAGERIVLSVHNAGAAIPAEALGGLFLPMRRGNPSKAANHSLGLGLFIVDQVVRAHGGRVRVRSTPLLGTAFQVVLPRA
jgi:signal transduction histidine kinase